jgi:hypothetical protein
MIFDKAINKESYDFFTFSNIRGRAGRLGEHHVGSVLVFNDPPNAELVNVSAPLFADLDEAPDELIVHMDAEDLTEDTADRVESASKELGLSHEELRRLAPLGVENLKAIKRLVERAYAEEKQLSWSGFPKFNSILHACEIICAIEPARVFGTKTARQLAFYISKLRDSAKLESFFRWHSTTYNGPAKQWDNVFKFLRACDHSLPEYFSAVEKFVRGRTGYADYSFFIAGLTSWFRPRAVKELEEIGVPAQVSERFAQQGDTADTLSRKVRLAASSNDPRISEFERIWILDSLI